jgi:hypothetical protein
MTLYAPPAVPVFATGYDYQPAGLDALIQAPLGFQSQGIVFRAEQHTGQPFAGGGTWTTVGYDTVLEDPYSGWDGTSKWTAPYTGWYEITVTNVITTLNAVIEAAVLQSGATRYELSCEAVAFALPGGTCGAVTLPMTGGADYVQGQIFSTAAGTFNTVDGRYSSIEITFVSQ